MKLADAQSLDLAVSWITGLVIAGCLILILIYEFQSRQRK